LWAGGEYFLKILFTLQTEEAWARAGHVVAWEQFRLPWDVPDIMEIMAEDLPPLSFQENEI
jgi:beta-galactosidase